MGIKSIRVVNILSFESLYIDTISDINCIIGQNNVGKTNLSKVICFFYSKLKNEIVLPIQLNSNYSPTGAISITFDTTRLKTVLSASKNNSKYQKFAYKSIFKSEVSNMDFLSPRGVKGNNKKYEYTLTLTIHKNGVVSWSEHDDKARDIINRIYPFYFIDTRRLDLYDWSKIWKSISQLKFINTNGLVKDEHIEYIDSKVSSKSNSYKDYVNKIGDITKAAPYSYQEKILNYIKVGLDGHTFNIDGNDLGSQSDGTNSHKYLELFLHLMIALTRREFITPTIFIDEPEIGLHPKKNEEFIYNLFRVYNSFKKTKRTLEAGKYATPYPNIIFSTHSPNIVKMTIKLFTGAGEHQVLHFSKKNNHNTKITKMNSCFSDSRFINIFSDNEARLFFSNFILFVEGETEVEIFGNLRLQEKFVKLSRIDVYRANEVLLNAMNPSFSNLSIPYLILYDADKMITINPNDGLIQFKKAEVNLFEIQDKYHSSLYNIERRELYREVSDVLSKHHDKKKDIQPTKFDFHDFNYSGFVKRINKLTVQSSRKFITATTIEGSLINESSLDVFLQWIVYEYIHNLPIGGKGELNKRYAGLFASYELKGDLGSLFSGLFGYPAERNPVDTALLKRAKQVKIKYLKSLKVEIQSLGLSKSMLVIIFRLIFEGKTDTLISMSNDNYKKVPKNERDLVVKFKDVYLKGFPCKTTKTGGWVTRFMNFSIGRFELDEMQTNRAFSFHFNRAFPEIYDIIRTVSVSID